MPSNSPSVSTAMCRLRPFSRLAASQPRGPPLSVVFTLWVSMMAAVGLGSRPAPSRSMTRIWWRMLSHTPSRRKARITHIATDSLPRRECRRERQMPPLAAGPHEVEQPVQQAPHVGRPRMTSGLGSRNERFEQAVLFVAQGLTGPVIPNQHASLRRPHGGFFPGKPPRTLLLRHLFRPKFARGDFQNSL